MFTVLVVARKGTTDPEMHVDTRLWDCNGMSDTKYRSDCLPLWRRFATVLRTWNYGHGECEWQRRLDPMNHHPFMPASVTCVEDTAPLRHTRPQNASAASRTFSHKAGANAAKFAIRTTVGTNLPVAEMGLFFPKIYDGALSQVMDQRYQRNERELLLADGHYDTAHNCIIPPRKPANANWTQEQLEVGAMIQLARGPVESVMGEFTNKQKIWDAKFQRYPDLFQMYYKTLTHMRVRDIYIKADAGQPRRRGCGPYSHWPGSC